MIGAVKYAEDITQNGYAQITNAHYSRLVRCSGVVFIPILRNVIFTAR
jgi:hypothetical protein